MHMSKPSSRPSVRRDRGYTLIEILVVLGIMMILMGLGMYGYGAVRQMIRIKTARADLSKLKASIEKYKMFYDVWPGEYKEILTEDPPGSGVMIKVKVYDDMEKIYKDLMTKYPRGTMLGRLEKDKLSADGKLYIDPWGTAFYVRIYRDTLELYSFGPDRTSDLGRADGDRRLPRVEELPAPAAAPYDDVTP